MTLALGLLGAGRIGQVHARNVAGLDGARIVAVHDPLDDAAARAAALSNARIANADDILSDPSVDAVLICTPTDLHAAQCEAAARAGKAVFCEKPIDLDLKRATACVAEIKAAGVPFMAGFNRRFDPDFAELKQRLDAGEIGPPELVQITSRDPIPPPVDYLRRSGGLFRDMMIHDFDMARFLLGDGLELVSATGTCLIDPAIRSAGDIDTAIVTLRAPGGALVSITNSRRASYGYDQRIEVHGATGMLMAGNRHLGRVIHAGSAGYREPPLQPFFLERYAEAYIAETRAFIELAKGAPVDAPTGDDALRALELADQASNAAGMEL